MKRFRPQWMRIHSTVLWTMCATVGLTGMEPPVNASASVSPVLSPVEEKVVYLTFDDGPSMKYTPMVLDILRKEHVHATFFVLGSRCEEFPNLVERMTHEGHEIGNHGFTHHYLHHIPTPVMVNEVKHADAAIERACGLKPIYFRPPGGFMSREGYSELHRIGHWTVLWTVDSNDWKALSPGTIIHHVIDHANPGAVVLFHDGISPSKYTVQALPDIIHFFQKNGYRFDVLPVGRTSFKVF